jgi:hypothetical protein
VSTVREIKTNAIQIIRNTRMAGYTIHKIPVICQENKITFVK